MLQRRSTLILLAATLATVLGWVLSRSPDSALTRAELSVWDYLARKARRTAADPKILFLGIDKDSVGIDAVADLQELFGIGEATTPDARALTLMSNGWPWPRSVYALILDRLIGAGAKVVVFDLNFPTPSEDDEAFRQALDRYGDRVVIGSNFVSSERGEGLDAGLTRPSPTLIPAADEQDSRVGFVNFWPDADGVIRHAQFQMHFGKFLGTPRIKGESVFSSLAAQAVRKAGRADAIPRDHEPHAFRYTAPPGQGFPHRSIFEIFVPEYWQRNFQSGKIFDDAIVVIGAVENWQHDEHQTPFGVMAGPEIQLNVINALMHGQFLRHIPPPVTLLIWIAAGAIAAGCAILRSRRWIFLGLLAIPLAWLGAQIPLFDRAGLVGPVVGPLAVMLVVGLFSLIYDLIRAGAEQLRLRLALMERKRAQEILERNNEELERRVKARTAELTEANGQLADRVEEKNVLLKEVHHRVKNNLQIISSLLNLQSGYIEDANARRIFDESRLRVRSMALIHEKLYQTEDLARIDFEDYLRTLTSGLQTSFAGKISGVRMSLEVESIMLGVDSAVPCGLIVNELVTNCFKYAFAGKPGEIAISMKRGPDSRLLLAVSDNGVGFPKDVDFRNTESLGMQLITTLSEQLDGTVAMRNGCGTTFEISFPEVNPTPK